MMLWHYVAAGLAVLAVGFTSGWQVRAWKAGADDQARAEQVHEAEREARRMEQARAARVQETQDAKEAELRRISARLADALERLRNRPGRLPRDPAHPGQCDGATGKELSRDDAAFLARFAAERDEIAAQLEACQGYLRVITARD